LGYKSYLRPINRNIRFQKPTTFFSLCRPC